MATVIRNQWPVIFAEIQWIDVDLDSEMRERYGLKIPVLMKNEQIVCESLVHIDRLIKHFGQPANPV